MLKQSIVGAFFVFIAAAPLAHADDRADCKAKTVTAAARVAACDRFIAAAPPSIDVVYSYYNRGISKRALGDYAGAIADLEAIPGAHERARPSYDEMKSGLGESMLTQALVTRGETKELMKNDQGALADYNAAMGRSPHSLIALKKRAPLLARLGRKAEAIADYRDLLKTGEDFYIDDKSKADAEAALKALGATP